MKSIYLQGMNKIESTLMEMTQKYSETFKGNFLAYRDINRRNAARSGAPFDDPNDWYKIYGKVTECYVKIISTMSDGFYCQLVLRFIEIEDLELSPDLQCERTMSIHLGKIDRYVCAPDLDALKLLLEVEE